MNPLRVCPRFFAASLMFVCAAFSSVLAQANHLYSVPDTITISGFVGSKSTQYITVTNDTTLLLDIYVASMGPDTVAFAPLTMDSVLISGGAGNHVQIPITFQPDSVGQYFEMIGYWDVLSGTVDSTVVLAYGVQRASPIITTQGSIAEAGLSDTVCERMTIQNPYATGPITITKIETEISNFYKMGYMLDTQGISLPLTLAADSSVTFGVCFTNRGQYHAYDSLGILYNDLDGSHRGSMVVLNTLVHGNVPDTSDLSLTSDSDTVSFSATGPGPVERILNFTNDFAKIQVQRVRLSRGGWNSPFDAVIIAPNSIHPIIPLYGTLTIGIDLVDTSQGTFDDTLLIDDTMLMVTRKDAVPFGFTEVETKIPVHASRGTEGVVAFGVPQVQNIVLYPNPTDGAVHLQGAVGNVMVTNVLGETVLTKKADPQSTTLDLSSIAAGTYYVRVVTANGQARTVKLIKQ